MIPHKIEMFDCNQNYLAAPLFLGQLLLQVVPRSLIFLYKCFDQRIGQMNLVKNGYGDCMNKIGSLELSAVGFLRVRVLGFLPESPELAVQ